MRSWLKCASSRLSSQRSTAQYDCFTPPSLERHPRARERVRELGRQAREHINTDFNVNDPNTPP
jgi:hypothetical protein